MVYYYQLTAGGVANFGTFLLAPSALLRRVIMFIAGKKEKDGTIRATVYCREKMLYYRGRGTSLAVAVSEAEKNKVSNIGGFKLGAR